MIHDIQTVRSQQKIDHARRHIKAIACSVFVACIAPSVAHSQGSDSRTASDTASKIEESFGRWTVLCLPRDGERICAVRQVQVERDSRKPVLLAELRVTSDERATGGVMLPNTLRKQHGVRIGLDGNIAENSLPIRNCSDKGCAVTVTFAGAALDKIKSGKVLQIFAVDEQGVPQTYSIDLAGFKQAADRAMQFEFEVKPKQ